MAIAGLRSANGDWESAKAAMDYALYFPDYIRYTENGHGQILDSICADIESMAQHGQHKFALRIATYTIERAEKVAENFEDDFDWISSIEEFIPMDRKISGQLRGFWVSKALTS